MYCSSSSSYIGSHTKRRTLHTNPEARSRTRSLSANFFFKLQRRSSQSQVHISIYQLTYLRMYIWKYIRIHICYHTDNGVDVNTVIHAKFQELVSQLAGPDPTLVFEPKVPRFKFLEFGVQGLPVKGCRLQECADRVRANSPSVFWFCARVHSCIFVTAHVHFMSTHVCKSPCACAYVFSRQFVHAHPTNSVVLHGSAETGLGSKAAPTLALNFKTKPRYTLMATASQVLYRQAVEAGVLAFGCFTVPARRFGM